MGLQRRTALIPGSKVVQEPAELRADAPASLADQTKAEFLEQAQELEVPGRSRMSKKQLADAIQKHSAGSSPAPTGSAQGAKRAAPEKIREPDKITIYIDPELKADLEKMLLDLKLEHGTYIPLTGLVRAVMGGLLRSQMDLGVAYHSSGRAEVEEGITAVISERLGGRA